MSVDGFARGAYAAVSGSSGGGGVLLLMLGVLFLPLLTSAGSGLLPRPARYWAKSVVLHRIEGWACAYPPSTSPYVRFRIRRFNEHTGVAAARHGAL